MSVELPEPLRLVRESMAKTVGYSRTIPVYYVDRVREANREFYDELMAGERAYRDASDVRCRAHKESESRIHNEYAVAQFDHLVAKYGPEEFMRVTGCVGGESPDWPPIPMRTTDAG